MHEYKRIRYGEDPLNGAASMACPNCEALRRSWPDWPCDTQKHLPPHRHLKLITKSLGDALASPGFGAAFVRLITLSIFFISTFNHDLSLYLFFRYIRDSNIFHIIEVDDGFILDVNNICICNTHATRLTQRGSSYCR